MCELWFIHMSPILHQYLLSDFLITAVQSFRCAVSGICCIFHLHFPDNWLMMSSILSWTCWPFVCLLGREEMSVQVLYFLIVWSSWVRFFIYSRYKSLIRHMICKYFLPSHGFFHLDVSLQHKSLILMKFSVSKFFSFVPCVWGIISKNPLSNKRSQRFIPLSSYNKGFTVLVPTIWFLMHLS